MGTIHAFSRTITILTRAKKLYLLALVLALLAAPIQAYITQGFNTLKNQTPTTQGSVIVEEHGLSDDQVSEIKGLMKKLGELILVLLILGSPFQYGIVKGALLYEKGKETSLGGLIKEGVLRGPGVFLINVLYGLIGLVFIAVSLLPIGIGLLTLPAGAVLVFAGLPLLLFTAAILTTMSTLAVPFYAEEGGIGAALKALGAVLKNPTSSAGFGFLLWIGVLTIGFLSATISLASRAFPGDVASYVSAFLEAPFQALSYELMWIGGVAFYLELKKKEEMERFEEEMKNLGIEI